jgi:hypothetical protein
MIQWAEFIQFFEIFVGNCSFPLGAITDAIQEKWNERCEEQARQEVEEITKEFCHPYEEFTQEHYPSDLRGADFIRLDVINPFETSSHPPPPVDIPIVPTLQVHDVQEKFSFTLQGNL